MPTAPRTHRMHPPAARRSWRARGYTSEWDRESRAHLERNPLCAHCGAPATVVDHLYPHRGDMAVFWDRRYWISLCASSHSGWKQQLERQGKAALDALARSLGLEPRG